MWLTGTEAKDEESEVHTYNSKVLKGKLRATVWGLTHRGGGGILFLDYRDTKSGKLV